MDVEKILNEKRVRDQIRALSNKTRCDFEDLLHDLAVLALELEPRLKPGTDPVPFLMTHLRMNLKPKRDAFSFSHGVILEDEDGEEFEFGLEKADTVSAFLEEEKENLFNDMPESFEIREKIRAILPPGASDRRVREKMQQIAESASKGDLFGFDELLKGALEAQNA